MCLGGVFGVGISSIGLPCMKGGFGTPSNLGGASTRNLGGPSNILSDLIGGISGPNGIGLETGCGSRSIGGLLKSS